jgi:hypothetical protein
MEDAVFCLDEQHRWSHVLSSIALTADDDGETRSMVIRKFIDRLPSRTFMNVSFLLRYLRSPNMEDDFDQGTLDHWMGCLWKAFTLLLPIAYSHLRDVTATLSRFSVPGRGDHRPAVSPAAAMAYQQALGRLLHNPISSPLHDGGYLELLLLTVGLLVSKRQAPGGSSSNCDQLIISMISPLLGLLHGIRRLYLWFAPLPAVPAPFITSRRPDGKPISILKVQPIICHGSHIVTLCRAALTLLSTILGKRKPPLPVNLSGDDIELLIEWLCTTDKMCSLHQDLFTVEGRDDDDFTSLVNTLLVSTLLPSPESH